MAHCVSPTPLFQHNFCPEISPLVQDWTMNPTQVNLLHLLHTSTQQFRIPQIYPYLYCILSVHKVLNPLLSLFSSHTLSLQQSIDHSHLLQPHSGTLSKATCHHTMWHQSESWEFILIRTCQCGPTSRGLCKRASHDHITPPDQKQSACVTMQTISPVAGGSTNTDSDLTGTRYCRENNIMPI